MVESTFADKAVSGDASSDSADGEAGGGPPNATAPAGGGATILLVDDKPELLDSLHQLITLHGYKPDTALGGEQALAMLHRKDYDVVLLDLIMPGVSGHDVLDFAAREELACKIIVVSGDASYSGVKHALHCGAFDFVKKPYEAGELVATMESALRQCKLEADNILMELQLRESESLHRFIVNSSPDLVYMLDRNGCFTFLNDRVGSLLGYRKEELIGRHYSEIVDPDYLDHARHVFDERRTGQRAVSNVEMRLKSRAQRRGPRMFHGHGVWMEITAMGVYSDPRERTRRGFVGTYGTARDVTERKEAEEVINFQAYHDLLTRLPNRALLKDRLTLAIAQAQRNKRKLAVMFLDLDRFKVVNDTLGHSMGDRLLKAVANRLQSCLRSGDTLSRFGGDEFMLLLPEVRTRDDVVVIAGKILERLGAPFSIDGHELFVGASIGISLYPEAGDSEEALIQNADIAMYHVKGNRRNGYQFFSEEMNHQFSTRLTMERELRSALAQEELTVHYQPQVDLETGRIIGVEALVRWNHPVQGLVEPEQFLALAAETGLVVQVDVLVQRQAFLDVARWRAHGHPELKLSVNVSSAQLEQDNFVQQFLAALDAAELVASAVNVEITEDVLLRDIEVIVPRLKALRRMGVDIAIDNFGTGYTSLSYLHQFPISTLKVDGSFVGDIRSDQGGAPVIDAIVAMAQGLKLTLVAEGVENRSQLRYLRTHGCREAQGYLFSRAVPATAMDRLLADDPYGAMLKRDKELERASARDAEIAPTDG
jgi:diguanylate cyclase (GGDEF)-like protein/PAS domain S-box-containing protein